MANGVPWEMKITLPRRRAIATINQGIANMYELGPNGGEYKCLVLGLCQEADKEGNFTPVFICEFENGRVCNLYTECIRFADIDDEEDEEWLHT